MRILFLGDVVGRSGRTAVSQLLPGLITKHQFEFVVLNGENAASGFGITEKILDTFLLNGADVVTTGNHVWDQREALTFADRHRRFLKPANLPAVTPGRGFGVFHSKSGRKILVINLLGRLFMDPIDDPFAATRTILSNFTLGKDVDAIIIDFHAEATSEKQGFAYSVDGQATLVAGTHTHVPTADYRVLPLGTAYITDAGMCGDYNSVVGMQKEESLNRFVTSLRCDRLRPATGKATICGVGVEVSPKTGLAESIFPIRAGGDLEKSK